MVCKTITVPNGMATICGLPKAKACHYCGRESVAQCDFPAGRHRNGRRKDCDRHLCDDHRGRGVTPNVDFCPEHFPIAKAAYERRQQREAA